MTAPSRSALIVASDSYTDPQLRQLRAPGQDAQALADVLRDPAIGNFDVRVLMNGHHYELRLALEDFFADRRPEDLLLLHFSCHGIKDESGRLFFAASDTRKQRLNATAIAADYVNDLLNRTRSRHVVVLLDCCFSGAFTRGLLARGGDSVDVMEGLQGRGRAVLTASGALEYAWEGDAVRQLSQPSIFTSAVVRGLQTGEADRDNDQQVSVDDLYDYVFDEVRRNTPNQTPGKWSNVEGTLVLARSPRPLEPSPALRAGRAAAAPKSMPARPPRTSQRTTDWLPAFVVGGGWMIGWLVSLALASSSWVEDLLAGVILVLVGWAITSTLVAGALRMAGPRVAPGGSLLIALGWPVCILVGVGAPVALRLGPEGAGVLGLSVAAAGLLGGLALSARDAPIAWERILLADAGWCAGWLWPGVTAWPTAFWRIANGYVSTFPDLLSEGAYIALASGGVLSGLLGGTLLYLLLRQPPSR